MRNNVKRNATVFLSFILDLLVIYAGFKVADYITMYFTGDDCFNYKNLAILEFLFIFFFYMFDLYGPKESSRENTLISVFLSTIVSVACAVILSMFIFERYTLVFAVSLFGVLIVFLSVWRMLFSFALVRFREKNRILVLESSHVPTRLARKLKYSCTNVNEAWYYIVDEEKEGEKQYIIDNVINDYDTVFISSNLSADFQGEIFEYCLLNNKTINLMAIPESVSLMGGKIYQFSDTPVIELGSIHLTRHQRFFKRVFDLFVALVGVIISLPFYLVIPLCIKLDSPGPVFYTQERYTRGKKVFKLYKFRTMCVDAEKNGEMLATQNDSRITRVGKVLRMLRLDELPQFFNILSGSMSVVGPRPERPVFADDFCNKVKHYKLRYAMNAGLTGYAQIYGKYNTRVSDKILMDLIYAIKYSFWLDIKLVILTVKTMFIKESTEGTDEETERILNTPEKEIERMNNNSGWQSDKEAEANENIDNSVGV